MKKVYSKLLLFGEHTVVKGSQALAIPFEKFSGQWRFADQGADLTQLQQDLLAFHEYLSSLENENDPSVALNTKAFFNDLQAGLYFDSNIPLGYGLGSSGALCTAVYFRYALNPIYKTDNSSLLNLKGILARMENFFHGSSSGADPLICYLAQPVILQSGGTIELLNNEEYKIESSTCLFLFDTGISRQTGPYVQLFLEKCKDAYYEKRVLSELVPANEAAIINYLQNKPTALFEDFHQISHFQFRYMSEMIPVAFRSLWLDSLSSDHFKLKICGAGGGGFLLGICTDFPKLKEKITVEFPDNPIIGIL